MDKFKNIIYKLLPGIIFVLLWQFLISYKGLEFYYGLPSRIFKYLVDKTLDGSLLYDTFLTFIEAIIGFVAGNIIGVAIGLSLWFSKTVFDISKPYIVALGSAPIFALAPLMIIWFGTGIFSKIMMATLSTLFIALFQSYSGASEVNPDYIKLLKVYKAPRMQIFRKIIVPSSVVWVINAFKINVGFALLGAFIGEYISSSAGLGHLILVASGLFDISLVLTGVFMMIVIAILLNYLVGKIERPLKKVIVRYL
jgi:NitT/TauT family transport system permease protein